MTIHLRNLKLVFLCDIKAHITSGVLKLEDTYLISLEDYDKVNKRSKVDALVIFF